MSPKELSNDVPAESERDSAIVFAPARDAGIGVSPENVAEKASVGNITRTSNVSDLLHLTEFRT